MRLDDGGKPVLVPGGRPVACYVNWFLDVLRVPAIMQQRGISALEGIRP